MEREISLKQVKNCSMDSRFFKLRTVSVHWIYQKCYPGSGISDIKAVRRLASCLFRSFVSLGLGSLIQGTEMFVSEAFSMNM